MKASRHLISIVAGARPNFMKIAPIVRALRTHADVLDYRIVHTGQHYDKDMSDVFFEELEIPKPDYNLDVGSGSHAEQTSRIMVRFEKVCQDERPDLVLVVGDVNSTLACSIVAKKLGIRVAHVEAGLRSGDLAMPEEINRMVTDAISDWFFVTEPSGVENLLREGHAQSSVHFVGHVMIDNLFHQLKKLDAGGESVYPSTALKHQLGRYGVVTLHRPSNVDKQDSLTSVLGALAEISQRLPLLFPVHPRTRAKIAEFGIALPPAIHFLNPLPFMEFLALWKDATCVFTDSGGLQEETTAVGIPCVTLRENTERPVTISEGSNRLVGSDRSKILAAAGEILDGDGNRSTRRPQFWDGKAAERIVSILLRELAG